MSAPFVDSFEGMVDAGAEAPVTRRCRREHAAITRGGHESRFGLSENPGHERAGVPGPDRGRSRFTVGGAREQICYQGTSSARVGVQSWESELAGTVWQRRPLRTRDLTRLLHGGSAIAGPLLPRTVSYLLRRR